MGFISAFKGLMHVQPDVLAAPPSTFTVTKQVDDDDDDDNNNNNIY